MLTDFENLPLLESARNLQQNCGDISHHTFNVFLHYLAKFKCSYIIIFDYIDHKHLAFKCDFLLT